MNSVDFKSVFENYQFAWYGQRAFDCVGLEKFINLDAILSCDYGLEIEMMLKDHHFEVFSIEETTFTRENWTSALLDGIVLRNSDRFIKYISGLKRPLYVIAYSSTSSLAQFALDQGKRVELIMPNPRVKIGLDDKIQFRRTLHQLRLPSMKAYERDLQAISYNDTIKELGSPFVVTFRFGSAGIGTFFVKTPHELGEIQVKFDNRKVLLSRYIEGISLNINAAVLGKSLIVAYPSIQLVGLRECASRPEIYCGNDFSAVRRLPSKLIRDAQSCVKRIGEWLGVVGYQGLFGVDLVVDMQMETIYPVDLNARFQNSTHVLTQMQLLDGEIPLTVLNTAVQMNLIEPKESALYTHTQMNGAQIILHNLSDREVMVTGSVLPGIYDGNSDSFFRKRAGISLLDTLNKEEFVVTCAVPRPGTRVKPGAPLLKIMTTNEIVDLDTSALLPRVSQFSRFIYDSLVLQPVPN